VGLIVQSTLSSSNDFSNRLLVGQGANLVAAVVHSRLEYRDWEWVITDGINQRQWWWFSGSQNIGWVIGIAEW